MRGKDIIRQSGEWERGITPAYAGKSFNFFVLYSFYRDHPRVCGEKPMGYNFSGKSDRITPAYAGKSKKH